MLVFYWNNLFCLDITVLTICDLNNEKALSTLHNSVREQIFLKLSLGNIWVNTDRCEKYEN